METAIAAATILLLDIALCLIAVAVYKASGGDDDDFFGFGG